MPDGSAQMGRVSALSPILTLFGHDLCNLCGPFLATVRVFLSACTYHNFPKLMAWHSDKSPPAGESAISGLDWAGLVFCSNCIHDTKHVSITSIHASSVLCLLLL